jgi:hypothetical protein
MKKKFGGKEFKLYNTYPNKRLAKKAQKRLSARYYTRITKFISGGKYHLGYDLWIRRKK